MPLKKLPTDLPIYKFPSPSDFETFLDREHETAAGFYIQLAKKASGIKSITAPEAVEVCLCFGWIDGGGGGSLGDDWWLTRYTPRRSKSMWSKKNTDTVARLTEQRKMRPAGIAAVEAAKADGRWDRAYDGPAAITVPDDLAVALCAFPTASEFFNGLNKSERYAVLHRVQTCSLNTRPKRIEALVQILAAGNVPGRTSKSETKPVKQSRVKKTTAKGTKIKAKETSAGFESTTSSDTQDNTVSRARASRRPGLRPRG